MPRRHRHAQQKGHFCDESLVTGMVVVLAQITLLLPEVIGSLKEKRALLQRGLDRTRDKFNVSIAETGSQDLWQRAEIGLAMVTSDRRFGESAMSGVVAFFESLEIGEIIEQHTELRACA